MFSVLVFWPRWCRLFLGEQPWGKLLLPTQGPNQTLELDPDRKVGQHYRKTGITFFHIEAVIYITNILVSDT